MTINRSLKLQKNKGEDVEAESQYLFSKHAVADTEIVTCDQRSSILWAEGKLRTKQETIETINVTFPNQRSSKKKKNKK